MRRLTSILQEIQRIQDWDQDELAEALSVTQPTISRWINERQKPEIDQRDRILRLARKLGVVKAPNGGEEYSVPVVGYAGAGGQIIYSEGQGPFGEARMPLGEVSETIVAVVVKGDSMAGQLEDGWTVYYDKTQFPPTEAIAGRLCVVGLADGRVLIKKLLRGSSVGLYHLISTNAAPMMDQDVSWAAPVIWIAPN